MPLAWEKYRHYKSTGWDDHTYQIIWLAKHSENWEFTVIYKPLYAINDNRLWDATFIARPLSMREEEVVVDGNVVKRFTKID